MYFQCILSALIRLIDNIMDERYKQTRTGDRHARSSSSNFAEKIKSDLRIKFEVIQINVLILANFFIPHFSGGLRK